MSPQIEPHTVVEAPVFPLLRLPLELRTLVLKYALQVEFIQYYKRETPGPVKNGIYGHPNLDYIGDYMAPELRLQVSDPRRGRARFRPLSELLPVILICRQLYSEVAPLLLGINVIYVSLQSLPYFVNLLLTHITGAIKIIGVLNNAHFSENLDHLPCLKVLTALEKVIIVPRGGSRDDNVGCRRQGKSEKKVVVLRELHRAIIYTT
ncbi:hypothetical protein CC86DRAFT_411579 [Ophiobolus disseminans]|uniref:Uncharacterized protein n=1 Tax=Ophiobolus disseminans TaxID=1469910 RepID=A0A6A6ZJK2_9PLEO|nr:hypothetical protein CC86DRAFT_411579 [Ophiobolus disseminans]